MHDIVVNKTKKQQAILIDTMALLSVAHGYVCVTTRLPHAPIPLPARVKNKSGPQYNLSMQEVAFYPRNTAGRLDICHEMYALEQINGH